jgi:phage terminase Nu1 subunit (DNA packaging protein)
MAMVLPPKKVEIGAAQALRIILYRNFRTKVQQVEQKFITTGELAQRLGLSSRRVATLASENVIVRTSRGFDESEAIRAYSSHMRRSATGKRGDGKAGGGEERRRLAAAQADVLELKLARERGSLVDAGEAERALASIVLKTRDAILRVPDRLASQLPHLSRTDVEAIDRALRQALTELSTGANHVA